MAVLSFVLRTSQRNIAAVPRQLLYKRSQNGKTMANKKKSPSARRRRRRILRILWLLVLLLVFLVVGIAMSWILTNDSEQIREDVNSFLNDVKGITPTPTSTPTPTNTPTPTPTPTNTPTPTPIAGRIIIDAGHGGSDDGAVYNGIKEKDISLDLALLLKERLEAKDYDVFLTRDSDDLSGPYDVNNNNRINPTERVELISSFSADLVISLHLNSYASDPSVNGLEILYGDNSELSKELADTLITPVIDACGTKNRGVKYRPDVLILQEADIPIVLIETGFITNSSDVANLQNFVYKHQLVQGIIEGVESYMKLH